MNDLERRLVKLQKQFDNLRIIGGEGVSVSGGIGFGGYTVTAKAGVADSGEGTGVMTPISGCTDPEATNFNPFATVDDASCIYDATGACCVDVDCTIETEAACGDLGGSYGGDDTTCDPNPCDSGACCHADHTCSITSEAGCSDEGDIYQGGGSVCADDCPIYRHVHWEWTLVSDESCEFPPCCPGGTADYGSGYTDVCYIEPVFIGSLPVSTFTTFTQHNCPNELNPSGIDYDCDGGSDGGSLGVDCVNDIFTCGYFGLSGCNLLDESCFCTGALGRFTDTLTTYWDNTPC